nr:Uncharacterised protein [Ipomoea batatas]
MGLCRAADDKVDQVVQEVGTDLQFKCIFRAFRLAMAVATRWGWWARDIGGANHCEEEDVQTFWDLLSTVVEDQAEGEGNIKVNTQDIGFNGGAKADSGLKIHKTVDERAAMGLCRATDNKVDQVVQEVGTDLQFKCIFGAFRLAMTVTMAVAARWGWWARDIGGANHCEEEDVQNAAPPQLCRQAEEHVTAINPVETPGQNRDRVDPSLVANNEEAEAGRVQVSAGANDAVRRKPRELPCHVGENIHGVGHDHENTIPGILHQLRNNLLEQRAVPLDEAEAALPGVLPRASGDDHEVRPGCDGVVHGRVDLGAREERGGVLQVQHLAAHLVGHGVDER